MELLAAAGALSLGELDRLAAGLAELRFGLAVDAADPAARVELGFRDGFLASRLPRVPFVSGGVVVCAGARLDRSASSHDCGFVSVLPADAEVSHWVWESPWRLTDEIRSLAGPRPAMQSVTVLAPPEGTELSLVVSKASMGVHRMREASAFRFVGGELVRVAARRTPQPADR